MLSTFPSPLSPHSTWVSWTLGTKLRSPIVTLLPPTPHTAINSLDLSCPSIASDLSPQSSAPSLGSIGHLPPPLSTLLSSLCDCAVRSILSAVSLLSEANPESRGAAHEEGADSRRPLNDPNSDKYIQAFYDTTYRSSLILPSFLGSSP
jgi:hypothetical protein